MRNRLHINYPRAWDVRPGDESERAKAASNWARQVIDWALAVDPLLLSKAALQSHCRGYRAAHPLLLSKAALPPFIGKSTDRIGHVVVEPGVLYLLSAGCYYYVNYDRYHDKLLTKREQASLFGKRKGRRVAPGTAAKAKARKAVRARIAKASQRRNRGADHAHQ